MLIDNGKTKYISTKAKSNYDLDCFSKLNLKNQTSKDNLSKTIQFYKINTNNINKAVANVLNQQITYDYKRNRTIIDAKRKLGSTEESLSSFCAINSRYWKSYNLRKSNRDNLPNHDYMVNEKSSYLIRSEKKANLPSLKNKNTTLSFSEISKTKIKERIKSKDESEVINMITLQDSLVNSTKRDKPESNEKQDDTCFYSKKKTQSIKKRCENFKIFEKKPRKKLVYCLYNNISNENQIDKHLLQTPTILNNTESINKSTTFSLFTRNEKFFKKKLLDKSVTSKNHSTLQINTISNTIFSNAKSDKKIHRVNTKSRNRLEINDKFKSLNLDISTYNKIFATELSKIKHEENCIKLKNNELLEEINNMTKESIERDKFKKEFKNDIKFLDRIKLDRSIYIYGTKTEKPKILKENEKNIFNETEKISKLSSKTAFYSKDILFEKFKINQNNKNPQLINFKIKKSKEEQNQINSEEKSKKKSLIILSLLKKIKKKQTFISGV